MKKILILIPDLRGGGAERVVVNLANNFSTENYELTLMTMFDVGVNKALLNSNVQYKTWLKFRIRGFWRILRFIPKSLLHRIIVKDNYDIEIAFLEGMATKIVAGASNNTKKVAWLHCELTNNESYFFEQYGNAQKFSEIYMNYDHIVGVSKDVLASFQTILPNNVSKSVVHNVLDVNLISELAKEKCELQLDSDKINFVTVGRITKQKGYDRLIKIWESLSQKYDNIMLYILGDGPDMSLLKEFVNINNIKRIKFLGFMHNPYSIIKQMDCFICSSYQEGYSTSVSEALFLGIPVISTRCSGSEELCSGGAGIVTENTDEALENGIIEYLENASLRETMLFSAKQKQRQFCINETMNEFLKMVNNL